MSILKIKTVALANPLQSSLLLMDFGLLIFLPLIRPPVVLSLVLVSGLVYLSMFMGEQLAHLRASATLTQ